MSEFIKEPLLINTGDNTTPVPVSQAILDGYAPGNELYTFAEFPTIDKADLEGWQGNTYPEIFYEVTKKLIGSGMPDSVLRDTAEKAYSRDNFDLADDGSLRFQTTDSGIHIVGLSDGPTGAFKDMPMQPLAYWMSYLQGQKNSPLTILLSTSGDTGPAALKAFGGQPNTEIINMLPREGVSKFQWAQMAEATELSDVHVLEVDGNFSYINDLHMYADLEYDLGSVNSVNPARIIAQIPYYVASYLKAIEIESKEVGDPVDVSVPSGNFGNALSAIIAREMGTPIRKIIIATNENDTLTRLIEEKVFKLTDFQHTDSSAQDVKMPSNVWRYFAMMFDNDTEKIAKVYETLGSASEVEIEDIGIDNNSVFNNVQAVAISAIQRAKTIKEIYGSSRIIIDPHTSNGLAAIEALEANEPDAPMLAMETAKPFKFNERIKEILGLVPERPDRFKDLEKKQSSKKLTQIKTADDLLDYIDKNTDAIKKA